MYGSDGIDHTLLLKSKTKTMHTELKKAIINSIFDGISNFQLTNFMVDKYRAYIYDANGEYLIGGKEVYQFIYDATKLITEK